jgi:hypothetical protein
MSLIIVELFKGVFILYICGVRRCQKPGIWARKELLAKHMNISNIRGAKISGVSEV